MTTVSNPLVTLRILLFNYDADCHFLMYDDKLQVVHTQNNRTVDVKYVDGKFEVKFGCNEDKFTDIADAAHYILNMLDMHAQ